MRSVPQIDLKDRRTFLVATDLKERTAVVVVGIWALRRHPNHRLKVLYSLSNPTCLSQLDREILPILRLFWPERNAAPECLQFFIDKIRHRSVPQAA